MQNNAKTMAALQSIYDQVIDIEAKFKKLMAREPEFKESEKEQQVLASIDEKIAHNKA